MPNCCKMKGSLARNFINFFMCVTVCSDVLMMMSVLIDIMSSVITEYATEHLILGTNPTITSLCVLFHLSINGSNVKVVTHGNIFLTFHSELKAILP